ncbi:Secretory immunoglobulin A-binding protein EsiB [Methylococcales bacterium]|nr:Secretory immunoglobulin A-binding protein EsiB [Methylococcales bacterium]
METIANNKWKELLARATNGSAEAQWELGYYYEYGAADESGILLAKIDPSKALHWHTLSAEQGNQYAQCSLSNILSTGEGIAQDYKAAIYWAKKAMAQGNAQAAFNLGTIYRDLKKPARAFHCYQCAASMGDKDSLLQLGLCCLFGFGTKQNFDTAYSYFQEILTAEPSASSQRTKENALYWIALFQLVGMGNTNKSVLSARKLLESANVDDDHEQANEILNVIGKSKYLSA